jgi:hypothetical protein
VWVENPQLAPRVTAAIREATVTNSFRQSDGTLKRRKKSPAGEGGASCSGLSVWGTEIGGYPIFQFATATLASPCAITVKLQMFHLPRTEASAANTAKEKAPPGVMAGLKGGLTCCS